MVYEPLLWSLATVGICSTHLQPLCDCCPHCQKSLSWLEAAIRPGYCSRCGRWLGQPLPTGEACQLIFNEPELKWQQWVSQVMGDLLAAAPRLSVLPQKDRIAKSLSQWMDGIAAGRLPEFFRLLQTHHVHVSYPSLWRWQTGDMLPGIDFLLQLCYCLGTSPLSLLTGEPILTTLRFNSLEFVAFQRPARKVQSPLEQWQQALDTILTAQEDPPPSLNQVARRWGSWPSFLVKHFPEQCHAISERHRLYRIRQTAQRRQRIRDEVRQATFKIYQQGVYPRLSQVTALLNQPNYMLTSVARAAWREALQELGV